MTKNHHAHSIDILLPTGKIITRKPFTYINWCLVSRVTVNGCAFSYDKIAAEDKYYLCTGSRTELERKYKGYIKQRFNPKFSFDTELIDVLYPPALVDSVNNGEFHDYIYKDFFENVRR